MSNKIKVAMIGAGLSGKNTYGELIKKHDDKIEVIAVAEPNDERRIQFKIRHNIKDDYVFSSWEELLSKEKLCDAIFICTNDYMHYGPAKKALEKGYHIVLENPMSNNRYEIVKLGELSKMYKDKIFFVCNILRYTPFFKVIKDVIDSKEIGDLISIQHNENIGYYNMAHNYVRGNWRSSNDASPIILEKSCNDMDVLLYLVGKNPKKISSFGTLRHFRPENAPLKSSDRCINCAVEANCPYSALRVYLKNIGKWPTTTICEKQNKDSVLEALKYGDYGKCVYRCQNDVVDNQATILEFENGVTTTFNLCAFTHAISRTIKLMGSFGEIRGNMGKDNIELHKFNDNSVRLINWKNNKTLNHFNESGEEGILLDFINKYKNREFSKVSYSIEDSVKSHLMALAAEESRTKNKVINIDEIII